MSLKTKNNFFNTISFRLTVIFALLFTVLLCVVYIFSQKALESSLLKRVDSEILQETKELENVLLTEGLEGLKEEIIEETEQEGIDRIFIKLYNSSTEEIIFSDLSHWKDLNHKDLNQYASQTITKSVVFQTLPSSGSCCNVRVISRSISRGDYILQFGSIMEDDQFLKDQFTETFGVVIILMLIFGVLLGWIISFKAMEGVRRITKTAVQIGKDGFDHRVQVGKEGEEIKQLSCAFNDMLDRIEDLMHGINDVTNSVAHDLRTSITRIQGIAETTLRGEQNVRELSEGYGTIIEECGHLKNIINTILEIAEAESKLENNKYEKFDTMILLKKAYDVFLPVAQDKGIEMIISERRTPLYLYGDEMKFQRIILGLLDNAIKFTNKGGNVQIETKESEDLVEVSIIDSGRGIEHQYLKQIFKKFYRIESSRTTEGNGLGLSLAQSIAIALGWLIVVESVPGKGSKFTLQIPL